MQFLTCPALQQQALKRSRTCKKTTFLDGGSAIEKSDSTLEKTNNCTILSLINAMHKIHFCFPPIPRWVKTIIESWVQGSQYQCYLSWKSQRTWNQWWHFLVPCWRLKSFHKSWDRPYKDANFLLLPARNPRCGEMKCMTRVAKLAGGRWLAVPSLSSHDTE